MSAGARRAPLFALAAAALLGGLAAGLARLGWNFPATSLIAVHGPLMVCGFFGTVIGLERAVAIGRPWAFAAPLLTGLGALALFAGQPTLAGLAMLGGAIVFLAIGIVVVRRQPALYTVTLGLGALAWVVGVAVWLTGGEVSPAVAAWACFLVLTIAGERLELSRFLPPSRWKVPGAVLAFSATLAGAALLAAGGDRAAGVFGFGLLALAAWMFLHDVARRAIRQPGLSRYMATCLLSGYGWLAVAGLVCLLVGLPAGGPVYDAALHSLFVGFVFAMVFGHAPIILPSVLRVPLPFHRGFYLPLLALHASLTLRVAGDLAGFDQLRLWGGLLNAATIVAFLLMTAVTVMIGRTARPATAANARNRGA